MFRRGYLLERGKNLKDLVDKAAALVNLGADAKYVHRANNLSDLGNAATARGNLGLGSAATQPATAFAPATHYHDASVLTSGTVDGARLLLTEGAIGSLGFFFCTVGYSFGPGTITDGSNLRWSNASGESTGGVPAGSWKCLGLQGAGGTGAYQTTLWQRIS